MLHRLQRERKKGHTWFINLSPFIHGVQHQLDGISIDEEITDMLQINCRSVYVHLSLLSPSQSES